MSCHSHLKLSSSNWLSSVVVTSTNPIKATHVDCNLLLSIYIIQVLKIFLPDLSHFVLPLYQPPISIILMFFLLQLLPFLILHYSLPFKTFPISVHIFIHLPSKLFIYFIFALIYTPFNLSLLLSVFFHTFLFCLFIASCQHILLSSLLFPNCSFYLTIPPHTLWALYPNSH